MVPSRYRILCIYGAMLAMTQYQWMRFAPITDLVASAYDVSYGQVGALSLAVTALALPLALPSGGLVDRWSVRACLRTTAAAMLLAALIRVAQPQYVFLLAGQLLFGFVQPLTMSLLVKLMLVWFPLNERDTVSALSSMVIFLGIGAAFILVPLTEPGNVAGSLWLDVAFFGALALLTFALVPHDRSPAGLDAMPEPVGRSLWADGLALLRMPSFMAVLMMIFLTNGYFSAITTWLEPILARSGVHAQTSGLVVVFMLAGGVVGAALIMALVRAGATVGRVLSGAALAAGLGTLCLFYSRWFPLQALAGLVIGAALLSPLPLLLGRVASIAGPLRSGMATAIFWLAGNIGATLMIAALGSVVDDGDWQNAAVLLCLLLLAQVATSLLGFRPVPAAAARA
ncbi:MFS transporter [Chromobacterium violaceum]|uniref:MFS transporter n=1 Tax=Chromobacterium violaceum TaxID=536 RepID=UPI001124DB29|nr:MFS transporter [Chromobacterium violaceum]